MTGQGHRKDVHASLAFLFSLPLPCLPITPKLTPEQHIFPIPDLSSLKTLTRGAVNAHGSAENVKKKKKKKQDGKREKEGVIYE